ncbi:tetratricopeptide repeat protein [Thalassomonas actiniarum]|uniref:Sel1 repeat family protein n=1 Tax=Thalassomonas actiniarum TaxID=485447 RepID=A0AAF0C2T3_9GAMM|nr:tetratricopeptide repeat protein [Thalassomonas actiniarum]WDD98243.1 sel1 repeat family protein [Thalassomonas actiniarum]
MKWKWVVIFIIATSSANAALAQGSAEGQEHFAKGLAADQKQDYKTAFTWYLTAAESGFRQAQFYLGTMYEQGSGTKQDYKKAAHWYLQAAKRGHAAAQNNLGTMYNFGRGMKQDYKQAVYWYRKAALQGHLLAQDNLGMKYYHGQGVEKDNKQAYLWCGLAAMAGDEMAYVHRYFIGKRLSADELTELQAEIRKRYNQFNAK